MIPDSCKHAIIIHSAKSHTVREIIDLRKSFQKFSHFLRKSLQKFSHFILTTSPYQSGFRPGYSTTTAFFERTVDFLRDIDKGRYW